MKSRWEAIYFLSERGVYPGYDVEDFEGPLSYALESDLVYYLTASQRYSLLNFAFDHSRRQGWQSLLISHQT